MKFLLALQFSFILVWTNIDESRGNQYIQEAHQILLGHASETIGVVRDQLASNHDELVNQGNRIRTDLNIWCDNILPRLRMGTRTKNLVTCVFLKEIWESYSRVLVHNQPIPDQTPTTYLDTAWDVMNDERRATIGRLAQVYYERDTRMTDACQLIENAKDSVPVKHIVVCHVLNDYLWLQAATILSQYRRRD